MCYIVHTIFWVCVGYYSLKKTLKSHVTSNSRERYYSVIIRRKTLFLFDNFSLVSLPKIPAKYSLLLLILGKYLLLGMLYN